MVAGGDDDSGGGLGGLGLSYQVLSWGRGSARVVRGPFVIEACRAFFLAL